MTTIHIECGNCNAQYEIHHDMDPIKFGTAFNCCFCATDDIEIEGLDILDFSKYDMIDMQDN